MESALPGPGCVEDGKASQQQEELPQPEEEKLQGEMENGSYDEQEMEETVQEEDEDDDGMEEDESCASSSMHAVATTGQMNGEGAAAASLKTNNKSPVNRTGRRNQEVKDRSNFICPLCDKNCLTQHQLTMHIRQHNTEVGGTDHSCSICGKALSSASSLDRHMLVHSGERPYKCTVCGQTFTTNGNMHRHMKIHDKDATGAPASRPTSPNKRRKAKRKLSIEEDVEKMDEPPSKKVFLMQQPEEQIPSVKREEDLLHCPICFKTFICKYGLESHMETHPDTALRCNQCCITFRTHRGLLRHNSVIHKQLPTDPTGRPFIQTNPSIPLGFSDLSFIDFSCHKFPQIAQVWCETNLRRCSSKFHRFVCEVCNKAFPLQVSLDLHTPSHKDSKDNCAELQKQEDDTNSEASKDGSDSADSKEVAESVLKEATGTVNGKTDFMESLGLQLSSLAKSEQSEEDIQQGILDSIRFIRVEPSATNLPQETNSSLGLCFLNPVSIQGMNKGNGLSLVSLQPLQGGLVVQPVSQNGVELADIQQILKLATSMPPQVHLLPNAPGSPLQADTKQITPLRPKPLVTPRSSMGVSTPPPPVMNAQQASSGCISPNLPPPAAQQLLTSKQSSNTPSSSTSSSPTNWESSHVGGDCTGMTGITAYNSSTGNIKQKEGQVNKKYIKTSGGKKTEYPCRFCSEVFSFPGGLQAHMRARHSGASPYKCSVCPYAAPDNATLMRHLRIHSGERPYVCRLCHYPFTVKANCERHLRKKHMKNSRKDIEKNIEYVTTSTNVSGVIGGTTLDFLESAGVGSTSCRYCGEDLKSYRALQIHLRTLNGCQRKPFECRQCGAAFLAKRNCILHLLKEHSEIPERDIEEHINTLGPLTAASPVQANPVVPDGPLPSIQPQADKQDLSTFTEAAEQDEPLDFSKKASKTLGSDIQPEAASASVLSLDDCSMEPIDLSMPKNPEGKKARTGVAVSTSLLLQEIKKDVTYLSTDKSSVKVSAVHAALPVSIPSIGSTLPSDLAKSSTRLKPLRPKPIAIANTSEMPPLASIAQIISSVSATPVLFKKGIKTEKCERAMSGETLTDKKCSNGTVSPEYSFAASSPETSKKRGKKKPFKEEMPTEAPASEIDMESSEEFPSVEKMLATTDANKFSPYLQPRQVEPEPYASEEEKEGKEGKRKVQPQSKGKKNAYSNSVQKMKCPYCPRVFPWTSSLQRHMLTHTGQKPFPCPQCDAFFSTKSNCERHLLRKHGVSSRSTVQNTGLHPKPKSDEGSQGSTEHFSDTGDAVGPKAEEETMNETVLPEQSKEQPECQKDLEISQCTDISNSNEGNKGLDINIASKLTESKPSGTEHHKPETKEPVLEQVSSASDEFPHTCGTCKKTFRHAATLIRHQKIHTQDRQTEERDRKMRPVGSSQPISANNTPGKEVKQETGAAENEENSSSIMESGTEDDEKEERNDDEECGSSEFRGLEEENESAGGRSDKRKKVCTMCTKRFWSLQDLTRHMRSHTGERPYQCQTCDRTFTLKHSLVRHQRIHQKAPDGRGADRSDDPDEADGARDDSAGEELRGSSGSESEAPSTASSEGGNAQEAEHQMVDKTGTKEEVSTEATEEPQAKEDNPEAKETADPQYNQGAPDV